MIKNKSSAVGNSGVQDDSSAEGKMLSVEELKRELDRLTEELAAAEARAQQFQEADLRSKADYRNLVRRGQEERAQFIKFATREFVQSLLQPLDHLSLAAKQLNDTGLNMVVQQFWQVLNNQGLEEINPVGQPFDVNTMEVVEKSGEDSKHQKVSKVVTKGYKLNGEVIQFARVILE